MLAGCPAETVAFRCPVEAPFPLVLFELGHPCILPHALGSTGTPAYALSLAPSALL